MRPLFTTFLFLMTGFLFISCGEDSESDSLKFDVAGEWNGEWQGATANGQLVVHFEQNRSELRGHSTANGNPCFTDTTIWGVLDCENGETKFLILDPNISEEEMLELDPNAEKEAFTDIEHVMLVSGTFTETGHLSLFYEIVNWGFCEGMEGTITLNQAQ